MPNDNKYHGCTSLKNISDKLSACWGLVQQRPNILDEHDLPEADTPEEKCNSKSKKYRTDELQIIFESQSPMLQTIKHFERLLDEPTPLIIQAFLVASLGHPLPESDKTYRAGSLSPTTLRN